jgi:3-oxoacyl-[acyl-carrier protein] reductase
VIVERLRLDGRAIVVSGVGGGGIGTATAVAIAEAGGAVVGFDVAAGALAVASDAVLAAGGRFHGELVDVADPTAVRAALDRAIAELGPVHGLVCVVGGVPLSSWGPVLDLDLATHDAVLRHNLTSALVPCQVVARELVEQGAGGSIVCLSSISGDRSSPLHASYGAAKAAIRQLVGTMALEWGGHGIRVNAVSPGTITTPRAADRGADPVRDRAVPLRRRGTPEEIAGAVLFLLSDLAGFVTAQTLVVDGGASARPSYLDDDDLPVFVSHPEIRAKVAGTGRAPTAPPH